MVVVKLTNELKSAILGNMRNYHHPKVKAATDKVNPSWGDRIYAIVIGNRYGAKIDALPHGFFTHTRQLTVTHVQVGGQILPLATRLDLTLSKEAVYPVGGHADILRPYMARPNSYSGHLTLNAVKEPAWGQLLKEIEEYSGAVADAVAARDAAVRALETLLAAHATLAPALKAWPTLWNFVPVYAQEKHKQIKPERLPAPAVDLSGLDGVTTEIMTKKLLEE